MSKRSPFSRLLDKIWIDYVEEFMFNKSPGFCFVRRGLANILVVLYTVCVLYNYHYLSNKERYLGIGVVIIAGLVFLIIFLEERSWRRVDDKMLFKEQKPCQLAVLHFVIGIILIILQIFPKVETFFCRWL